MVANLDELLAPGGPIARRLEGFEPRAEQIEMAHAVARALAQRRHLLAEAGTGVGKSFAYLLPAVLHACANTADGPVVVSTRTIALQQQLETKDLPFLHAVLPLEWSSVTAVGRNNYLCLRRMHLAQRERASMFADAAHEADLARVVRWSLDTPDGLRMELDPPVEPAVWEEVQAEHGNCLHRACPYYQPCPYQRSRRRLETAQILVVNHALYMADVALRAAGAAYLPDHRVVVFDEAHHLERIATEGLGLRLSESTVLWHLRRLQPRRERGLLHEHGSAAARILAGEVRDRAQTFFAALQDRLLEAHCDTLPLQGDVDEPLSPLLERLGEELTGCAAAITKLDLRMEMQARSNGLRALAALVRNLCGAADGSVRWLEAHRRGAVLRSAPLDVSETLRAHVFAQRTAILTSATLDAGRESGFGRLRAQLGIDRADTLALGSPFDYRARVQVVIEEGLPDPGSEADAFVRDAKTRILDHLLANRGRALVLCTSWAFVRAVADFARPALEAEGLRLLVQGEAPLARLLADKRGEETSVLIGTDSLWEGIDLPGEALTLVIVARLPFAPPGHPLTEARLRTLRARGKDPFFDHSLPEAVLRFRQGFGRLLRRTSDHGKVVVLDPRIRTRRYGRAFLDALPAGAVPDVHLPG
jgi:ATP-dependent DNA helicase DinG